MKTIYSLLLLILGFALPAMAQEKCSVGLYSDADGTSSWIYVDRNVPFEVYVVLFSENVVSAASFSMDIEGLGVDTFILFTEYGPSAGGINIATANGENVGLGECAIGFGGAPIVVAKHSLFTFAFAFSRIYSVTGNADEDPNFPVMSTCAGEIIKCAAGWPLILYTDVPVESKSFGAVKSLFGK